MKHTPGPYRVQRQDRLMHKRIVFNADDRIEIVSPTNSLVAVLYRINFDMDGHVDAANARLLAAAPEMREILEAVAHDPKSPHQGAALAVLAHIDGRTA